MRHQEYKEALFQFEASKHRLQFIQGERQQKSMEKLLETLGGFKTPVGNKPPGDGTVLRRLSQGDHSSNGYLQVSP